MQAVDPIFLIIVLVLSVVIHEVSHGYMADLLGDPTARRAGRLTLNPLAHLDWLGSVVVPLMLYLLPGGLMFGWAKPVPYNPYNLRLRRWGPALVAVAGPVSNLIIATVFGLALRYEVIPAAATTFAASLVLINLMLAIFNLLPLPPLDGSKILFALLPAKWAYLEESWQRHQLWWLIIFLVLVGYTDFLGQIVFGLFRLIVG
jgi:Zn-dependent protease